MPYSTGNPQVPEIPQSYLKKPVYSQESHNSNYKKLKQEKMNRN